VVTGTSLALFAWRAPKVGLGGRFDLVSRESMLLGNNVLLVVAAASVLLGTLYPLILDALGMGKVSVGPPYFQAVFVPLMAPALFLMGIGPLARWKSASLPELAVRLRWAFGISMVTGLLLPFAMGHWSALVSLGLILACWIFATAGYNLWTRIKPASGAVDWSRALSQPRSYYGMLLAHCGVAVFVVGVTMVKGYEVEKDVRMETGDTAHVGGYQFRFDGVAPVPGPNYSALRATVTVTRNGQPVTVLTPEKRNYFSQQMPMTEASINPGLTRDLYVSLGEPVGDAWVVRVYYKPFVDWIWGGCMLMALGGLFAVSDRRYRLAQKESPANVSHGSGVAAEATA
jgi:cytochrome c-type biogenesis protein CcmF